MEMLEDMMDKSKASADETGQMLGKTLGPVWRKTMECPVPVNNL